MTDQDEPQIDINGDGNVIGEGSSSQVIKIRTEGNSSIGNIVLTNVNLRSRALITFVMVVGLVVVLAVVIANVEELSGLLSTPLPFPAAKPGESLIIVADFDDRSAGKYEGIDFAQYIYEQLVTEAAKDGLNVRIERFRKAVDDSSVKQVGRKSRASLVVWGWYDTVTITLRLERVEIRTSYRSSEEGQHQSLADADRNDIEDIAVSDLPRQATYLTLLVLGVDSLSNGDYGQALGYLNSALEAVPAGAQSAMKTGEAFFFRGIAVVYDELTHSTAKPNDSSESIWKEPQISASQPLVDTQKSLLSVVPLPFDPASELDDVSSETLSQAFSDFDQAVRQKPSFAEAYYNRGLLYRLRGDKDSAAADIKEFLDLSEHSPWRQQAEELLKTLNSN